jgi:hypothetical protein
MANLVQEASRHVLLQHGTACSGTSLWVIGHTRNPWLSELREQPLRNGVVIYCCKQLESLDACTVPDF